MCSVSSQTLQTCQGLLWASCPSVLFKSYLNFPLDLKIPGFVLFFSGLEVFNIQSLCQKMLQGETHPKEICVTILITCAPLLQLHPWLISFRPFKFVSNDLYATKLGQVWREVSSSVNCFRQWCAANSESSLNRCYCDSFALSISLYSLLSFLVWLFVTHPPLLATCLIC